MYDWNKREEKRREVQMNKDHFIFLSLYFATFLERILNRFSASRICFGDENGIFECIRLKKKKE
jgi:hypothetical protein